MNPKEAAVVAARKAPLEFLEPAGDEETAHVMWQGAELYGYRNYALSDCKVRTYIGAVQRHLLALRMGDNIDPDSGRSHWAHIRACCDVVFGAEAAGTLVDDRVLPVAEDMSIGTNCPPPLTRYPYYGT